MQSGQQLESDAGYSLRSLHDRSAAAKSKEWQDCLFAVSGRVQKPADPGFMAQPDSARTSIENHHSNRGETEIMISPEKQSAIIAARESGLTFRQVGEKFNVGAVHARNLYRKAIWRRDEWPKSPLFGLTVRAANSGLGYVVDAHGKENLVGMVSGGRLNLRRLRGVGNKTEREILAWLGLPVQTEKKPVKVCPHCGKPI